MGRMAVLPIQQGRQPEFASISPFLRSPIPLETIAAHQVHRVLLDEDARRRLGMAVQRRGSRGLPPSRGAPDQGRRSGDGARVSAQTEDSEDPDEAWSAAA